MMCTTMSPRSTSTHSPVSSPSMLTMWPPFSFTLSRTDAASALVWRLEVPDAMAIRSNMLVRWAVSYTRMSCALTSSRASMTAVCSFLISISFDIGDVVLYSLALRGGSARLVLLRAARWHAFPWGEYRWPGCAPCRQGHAAGRAVVCGGGCDARLVAQPPPAHVRE